MKIYLAMTKDRHYGTEAMSFSTAEKAIAYARATAIKNARDPDDFCEVRDEWLYYADYSLEGDCVWVVETNLNAETVE